MVDGETQHKDFENSCYLFMSNMCKYPGQEFYIVSSGTCEKYFDSRRNSANQLLPVKNITQNITEFSPPPNEDENVVSSNLGWSFCGSSR
ncbi:hypothetical protein RR46_06986 [Papilio xuthus]|uniref:Uncharacterized protein n=1 Tax=Papilio xuthus TaxID=66420 RepID=A0A194QAF4_PAPXU|nr:hypothetical protein RR46_06986 [Papilio xuthus]